MQGFTSTARHVQKMQGRLDDLHKSNKHRLIAQIAHNSLVMSLCEFNPLHNSHSAQELSPKIDGKVARLYSRNFGLTQNDPKHSIFLPPHQCGHGLRHAGMAELGRRSRDLEIHSNANAEPDDDGVGEKIRSRLEALRDEPKSPNFLRRNIIELATYGYFFRDLHDSFHTEVMERLLQADPDYQPPLGAYGHFSPGDLARNADIEIGHGHRDIGELYSFGSPLCSFLKPYTDPPPRPRDDIFTPEFWRRQPIPVPITPETLAEVFTTSAFARAARFSDAHIIYEWRSTPTDTDPSTSPANNWTNHTPPIPWSTPQPFDPRQRHKEFITTLHLSADNPNDKPLLDRFHDSNSPFIVSTDAGTVDLQGKTFIVATTTLNRADLSEANLPDPSTWDDKKAIPERCLVQLVPSQIGNSDSTNNTGELAAFCLREAILPTDTESTTITDSQAIQKPLRKLRDAPNSLTAREKIRWVWPKLGKAAMSRPPAVAPAAIYANDANVSNTSRNRPLLKSPKDHQNRVCQTTLPPRAHYHSKHNPPTINSYYTFTLIFISFILFF